jgi:hypothetical protein
MMANSVGRKRKEGSVAILVLSVCLAVCSAQLPGAQESAPRVPAGPVKVEIRKENGSFRLYRGGQPYFIKGAVYGGDPNGQFPLKELKARGGNSIRSGGTQILDEAQRLGMTVLFNLPMGMELANKFNYSDPVAVRQQFEEMKKLVMEFKDHPAVLMWAIGNELEVGYKDRNVWNAVNDVAKMIHEVDPNHPALTVVGDDWVDYGNIQEIERRAPDLDLLGVNDYHAMGKVPAHIRTYDWNKPYVMTEWGPSGDWAVPRTEWKAAMEETSTEKAQLILENYRNVMLKDAERCLGSYVFIWLWRFERTHTWYGMFLESGERTEAVNVMQYVWTGHWPANRAPRIEELAIDGKLAADNIYLKPGDRHTATLKVRDPEGDPVTLRWEIVPEIARAGYAGMGEKRTNPMPELIQKTGEREIVFTAPQQQGAYRVFVFALDGQGNAATANVPFFVRP